jgi:hypothetical protein
LALTTSLAEAHLIPLTTGFVTTQATDPTEAFTFHGSPYAHKFLRVGALVPGQASGTSVSGPLDSGGSFTVAFRDTPSGQIADVTFDLLGTPETLAGFIAVAPLGRGNFCAVTLDEAL